MQKKKASNEIRKKESFKRDSSVRFEIFMIQKKERSRDFSDYGGFFDFLPENTTTLKKLISFNEIKKMDESRVTYK